MGKKLILFVVLIVIVAALVVLLSSSGREEAVSPAVTAPAPTQTPTPQTPPSTPPTTEPDSSDNVVRYTDSGFSPSSLTVQSGETVVFENQSSGSFWPASAIHPTHAIYPTTGGCIGSTFDACQGLPPGSSWSFRFDEREAWKYHDHLSPSRTGTIVVE